MSLFSSIGHWFVSSGLADKTKQAAVEALTKSANDFVSQVQQHAPDLADHVQQQVVSALATAVAGALTRKA